MKLYFDGAVYKTHYGCGWILKGDDGWLIQQHYFGGEHKEMSSIKAEYMALKDALNYLIENPHIRFDQLEIIGDCRLAIDQLAGKKRIGRGIYKQTATHTLALVDKYFHNNLTFTWTRRENNKEADKLAKMGLKENL